MTEQEFSAQALKVIEDAKAKPPEPSLNTGQAAAVEAILAHLHGEGSSPFIVLAGPAGTGKTFCVKRVLDQWKRKVVLTAPTNKAVRVLRDSVTRPDYKPQCCTIYSLLGLRMTPDGEIKVLAKSEEEIDLSDLCAVFVDEAFTLGTTPWAEIESAARLHPNIRWVLLGDKWQIPPVKENKSPVEDLTNKVELDEVMRTKNPILTAATYVREAIALPFRQLLIPAEHDAATLEGVWKLRPGLLLGAVRKHAGEFAKPGDKAIAWRNVTVEQINRAVRQELFENSSEQPYFVGDRVTLLEPAKDQTSDKETSRIIGITDEEGTVERVDLAEHPVYKDFSCWRMLMRSDTNAMLTLWVLHGGEVMKYTTRKARLASEAKVQKSRWREYWEFCEAFHSVRHAYATTAHRAQGSTYNRAYVDFGDIMRNGARVEALRCLYVAVSRPRKELYLG